MQVITDSALVGPDSLEKVVRAAVHSKFFFSLRKRFRIAQVSQRYCPMADCVNSSPPLISWEFFQAFGGNWANSGNLGENSVELSGIRWGFVWRLV